MLRVLIVDDEMLARDELKYLLHRTKEVDFIEEAESIEEALDKMMDEKPDLLFLDIQLSDDSGFDIAKRLKKMKNPPAIIFATAYDQYALQAFEVDAIDYILKPFDEERVVQAIHKYKKNACSSSRCERRRIDRRVFFSNWKVSDFCRRFDCVGEYKGHLVCRINRRRSHHPDYNRILPYC